MRLFIAKPPILSGVFISVLDNILKKHQSAQSPKFRRMTLQNMGLKMQKPSERWRNADSYKKIFSLSIYREPTFSSDIRGSVHGMSINRQQGVYAVHICPHELMRNE